MSNESHRIIDDAYNNRQTKPESFVFEKLELTEPSRTMNVQWGEPVVEEARKLATIRLVSDVQPIPGADNIEVASVDGWKVVVMKGEFQPGDMCVYFEIDSFLPGTNPAFEFLRKRFSTYKGVEGCRLKTMKLRGQVSQGLAMPWKEFLFKKFPEPGDDVTGTLGIVKWERVVPQSMQARVKGNFPSFIPKTDQERVQNLVAELPNFYGRYFEVTEKMDGTSMTVYHNNGICGVCSRNLDLKLDDDNVYTRMFNELEMDLRFKALQQAGLPNMALQGELCGPGIQKNPRNLDKVTFFVYDIWDIDAQEYLLPEDRQMQIFLMTGMTHVPIMNRDFMLSQTVQELLDMADQGAVEGLVFKTKIGHRFSFKAISNKYLLKEKD